MKTLKDAKIGDTVKVVKLHGEGPIKRRIMDMGITKGTEVYIRKVAPLGDPMADFFHFAQHKGFGADLRPVAVIEHLVKPAESFDALRFSIVQIHKPRMIQKDAAGNR